jgi:hypothetical protein
MSPPDFTPEELRAVRRICAPFRPGRYRPGALRELIARRLEWRLGAPALAARVRLLSAEQLAALNALIGKVRSGR